MKETVRLNDICYTGDRRSGVVYSLWLGDIGIRNKYVDDKLKVAVYIYPQSASIAASTMR